MSGGRCEISRGDTCGAREAQFIFVLADHCYAQACVRDGGAEDARNSLREFAVADYGGFAVLADVYLLQDFACGGERLVKTADSSGTFSGTRCRFMTGNAKNSAKAPSWPMIPRTLRRTQCVGIPRRQ